MSEPPRLSGPAATLLAGGLVLGTALLAQRWGPQPPHLKTAAWYARLRKPSFTPPGPVIGGVWGILEALLAIGGARLLAAPVGPARRRARALAARGAGDSRLDAGLLRRAPDRGRAWRHRGGCWPRRSPMPTDRRPDVSSVNNISEFFETDCSLDLLARPSRQLSSSP